MRQGKGVSDSGEGVWGVSDSGEGVWGVSDRGEGCGV